MDSARRVWAEEVWVLNHVRRAVALALGAIGAVLPVLALVADGAKRWPGA